MGATSGELAPRKLQSPRLFSSKRGAVRSRRPTDVILLAVSVSLLLITAWAAEPPGSLSNDLLTLFDDLPSWVRSLAIVGQDLMIVWAAFVLLAALIRWRLAILATALASVALSAVIGFVLHRFVASDSISFGPFLERFTASDGPASFPGIRLVVASAVAVSVAPALSRPFRFFGRLVLAVGFLATVVLSLTTLVGAVGGLAVGSAAAVTMHLLSGSPGGRPAPDEVRRVLGELGVEVDDLQPASLEPRGVVMMDAVAAGGAGLTVKVYGRDAWDGQFINVFWRSLWYRDSRSRLLLTRSHQVEHEALMTLLAQRAGVPVPDLIVAGTTSAGDAAMVTASHGRPLVDDMGRGADPSLTDTMVPSLWETMNRLHARGQVDGGLDRRTVDVDEDYRLLVVDWASSSTAALPDAVAAERAQLLVLTAMLIGQESAIRAARDALGDDALVGAIPYVQKAALNQGLRRDVNDLDLDLDALRDLSTVSLGVDQVELVELRRVTFGSVATIVLVAVAAMLLISSLSEIGIDTIVDELSTASWGWVLAALVTAQCARFWSGLGTTGATDHPLRLGPTVVLEFAITFVNLVIPSSAARFATKMRYFQRSGMTLTSATSMSVVDSLAGFTVQITILISGLLLGVGGIELDLDIDDDSVRRLIVIVVIAVVAVAVTTAIIIAAAPSVRERARSTYRQIRDALRVVKSPTRMLRLFGGNAMAELTFASVLGLSLLAYGESVPIVSLLVVNVGVALFAGLMPVPGGVGITEAALTAGLVAIGVPEATAFAAAITTRLCTFYLPPIWGYVAMRWLRNHEYL